MVKLVQLLSIAVPTLSVKVEDPQALLQLANAHRGTSTQKMHNSVASMESRMSQMVLQAIANPPTKDAPLTAPRGATPTLSQDAFDTMTEALNAIETSLKETEKGQNQEDWDVANTLVGDCNTDTNSDFNDAGGVEALLVEANQLKSTHNSCRAVEDTDRNAEFTTYETKEAKEQAMKTAANAADRAKPTCQTKDRSPTELLEDLGEAKTWAVAHTSNVRTTINEYNTASNAYNGAVITADEKAVECDQAQTTYEVKFCEFKTAIKLSCKQHDACITRTTNARTKVHSAVTEKIVAEKVILKSCGKVRCFMGLLQKGHRNGDDTSIKQSDYDFCNGGEGTYVDGAWVPTGDSVLDIVPGDLVEPDTCDSSRGDPAPDAAGTPANYYEKELEWMPQKTGIEAMQKC